MGEKKRRMLAAPTIGAALAAAAGPDRLELATRKAEAATTAKAVIDKGGRWFLAYVDPTTNEVKFSVNDASPELVVTAANAFMHLVMQQVAGTPQPSDPAV